MRPVEAAQTPHKTMQLSALRTEIRNQWTLSLCTHLVLRPRITQQVDEGHVELRRDGGFGQVGGQRVQAHPRHRVVGGRYRVRVRD